MNLHVLVMIRFRGRGLAANVARERPESAVDPHVVLQIIGPVKRLSAHVAIEHFRVLVLFDMPLTVIFADELRPAIIARVRSHAFVGIHMRYVIGFSNEGPLALIALERLRHLKSNKRIIIKRIC